MTRSLGERITQVCYYPSLYSRPLCDSELPYTKNLSIYVGKDSDLGDVKSQYPSLFKGH